MRRCRRRHYEAHAEGGEKAPTQTLAAIGSVSLSGCSRRINWCARRVGEGLDQPSRLLLSKGA